MKSKIQVRQKERFGSSLKTGRDAVERGSWAIAIREDSIGTILLRAIPRTQRSSCRLKSWVLTCGCVPITRNSNLMDALIHMQIFFLWAGTIILLDCPLISLKFLSEG